MTEACFQMKGSVITTIVLEVTRYSKSLFDNQLTNHVKQAPTLFQQSPIVISLEKLEDDEDINFASLLESCSKSGLQPMAFKGAAARHTDAIRETGLAMLPASPARTNSNKKAPAQEASVDAVEPDQSADEAVEPHQSIEEAPSRPAKLISQPVRSGQQIYAEGADLIIVSQVSEGAELLADGHIHVYGALRGRALAGVKGDKSARIFSRSMEAELLSVAGDFVLSEELRSREELWKKSVQVFLSGAILKVEAL